MKLDRTHRYVTNILIRQLDSLCWKPYDGRQPASPRRKGMQRVPSTKEVSFEMLLVLVGCFRSSCLIVSLLCTLSRQLMLSWWPDTPGSLVSLHGA